MPVLSNKMISTSIYLLLLTLFAIPTEQSTQLPNNYAGSFCLHHNGNYTQGSTFQNNLKTVFSALESNSSSSHFSYTTISENPDPIYGRYTCRHDTPLPECDACVKTATKQIVVDCPTAKEAVVWFEQCTLLYANSSSRLDDYDLEIPNVRIEFHPSKVINVDEFYSVLVATLNRDISVSAYGNASEGFATAEANASQFETLYSLTQCSGDVTGLLCERCLRNGLFHADLCCKDSADIAFFYPNCQLRYSVSSPFYVARNSAPMISPGPPGVASSDHQSPRGNGAVGLSFRSILQLEIIMFTTLILILRN